MSNKNTFLPTIMDNIPSFDKMIAEGKRIMWTMVQYKEMQMVYNCALREIKTKFEVLDAEFDLKNKRNPISSIQTRLKSTESVMKKLAKYRLPATIEAIENGVHDFAGVRVICSYIDDIYSIAEAFLAQDDVTLIEKKDYIENPKPNGYRSLHLIVSIPVFFSDRKKNVTAEVQIRTVAMDFWASLEHQMRYKRNVTDGITDELRECAAAIAATDEKMLEIRERIDAAEDIDSEDDELLSRLQNIARRF